MDNDAVTAAPVLEVIGLRYAYRKHRALRSVTFSVNAGSIHGFVGPNGAGKTTTLKILATLLRPQSGKIRVLGRDIVRGRRRIVRQLGYMPDHLSLYRQMTVFECLDFFAAAYGLRHAERGRIIRDVLTLTDMTSRMHDPINGLSRGMQQRVSLARALVHDPQLLLLDEPAAGLDPRARIELMEILRELSRMGKTIFISSHILSELATLCDSVTIIDRGIVKYSGTAQELGLEHEMLRPYVLTLAEEHPATQVALEALDGVTGVTPIDGRPAYRLTIHADGGDTNSVLSAVLAAGGRVEAFERGTKQLSDLFMELTEPGVRE